MSVDGLGRILKNNSYNIKTNKQTKKTGGVDSKIKETNRVKYFCLDRVAKKEQEVGF